MQKYATISNSNEQIKWFVNVIIFFLKSLFY